MPEISKKLNSDHLVIEFPGYLPNFSTGGPRKYFPTSVNNGSQSKEGVSNEISRANEFPSLFRYPRIFHLRK